MHGSPFRPSLKAGFQDGTTYDRIYVTPHTMDINTSYLFSHICCGIPLTSFLAPSFVPSLVVSPCSTVSHGAGLRRVQITEDKHKHVEISTEYVHSRTMHIPSGPIATLAAKYHNPPLTIPPTQIYLGKSVSFECFHRSLHTGVLPKHEASSASVPSLFSKQNLFHAHLNRKPISLKFLNTQSRSWKHDKWQR